MDLYLIMDTRYSRVTGWRWDLEEAQARATQEDFRKEPGQWEQHASDENRWIEYTSAWDGEHVTTSPLEVHRLRSVSEPAGSPRGPFNGMMMELEVTTADQRRVSLRRAVPEDHLTETLSARMHLAEFARSAASALADQIERS